ncbi:DUF3237 domain-containing protein [Polymorphobacter megasporae]|uniref:DUF3237 domain-containing protein n=1 Tax=Glacieibacterium megasporae TaxID=2835787 RepID=UPI0021077E1E|nr:DUF3237 domain-containing protein [Polymorphobacter megasporae]
MDEGKLFRGRHLHDQRNRAVLDGVGLGQRRHGEGYSTSRDQCRYRKCLHRPVPVRLSPTAVIDHQSFDDSLLLPNHKLSFAVPGGKSVIRRSIVLSTLVAAGLPGNAVALTPHADQPPVAEFVFEEVVTLAIDVKVGETPLGGRNIVPITGGTFEGPRLRGTIMPGGWDWQLATTGGCFKLEANYMLRTDDGAVINIANKGTSCRDLAEPGARLITVPTFEAPLGRYAWLNDGAYWGTLEGTKVEGKPAVRIRIYKAR